MAGATTSTRIDGFTIRNAELSITPAVPAEPQFEVGDVVKVVRRAGYPWVSSMDETINYISRIRAITDKGHYQLDNIHIYPPESLSLLKIGDRVRVVRKVEKEDGWANSWSKYMDNRIGREFIVKEISELGIRLDIYNFPPSSLEALECS